LRRRSTFRQQTRHAKPYCWGAWALTDDQVRWRAYVRDAIIDPAIGRDVLALGEVRRPALLRQVFAVSAGSPAQIVSLQKIQGQLTDPGALETLAHYLALLQDAYLVAALEKFAKRAIRQRAAPPKLGTLNNALLSAMHPEGPPDEQRDGARFGAWIENACLAAAVNHGQRVTYGEKIEHYVASDEVPPEHSRFAVDFGGRTVSLGLKLHPDKNPVLRRSKLGGSYRQRSARGFVRIAAQSSTSGVVRQTRVQVRALRRRSLYRLQHFGEFFLRNHRLSRAQILVNAVTHYEEFANMVRPVQAGGDDVKGTAEDGLLYICTRGTELRWAFVVLVRTGESVHAVLVPIVEDPIAIEVFLKFPCGTTTQNLTQR